MTLKWKQYPDRPAECSISSGDVAATRIIEAPDYYDGAVEALEAKQAKIIEAISAIVDALPPHLQRQVLDKLGNYAYTEVQP